MSNKQEIELAGVCSCSCHRDGIGYGGCCYHGDMRDAADADAKRIAALELEIAVQSDKTAERCRVQGHCWEMWRYGAGGHRTQCGCHQCYWCGAERT